MSGAIKKRIDIIVHREGITVCTKFKDIKIHRVTRLQDRRVADYEFCLCDYCLKEIILNKLNGRKKEKLKEEERTGGIITLPAHITGNRDLELALHSKCLKLAIQEFQEMNMVENNKNHIPYLD